MKKSGHAILDHINLNDIEPERVPMEHEKEFVSASQEHEVRVAKLARLRGLGHEPWPAREAVDATCQQIIKEFVEDTEKNYKIAGRIMTRRDHGKTFFANLQDRTGTLQLYIKQDVVGEQSFNVFKELIDVGDILWFSGTAFKTKSGEITLRVQQFKLLSKCLHPLPEKFHGITDQEIKYRQRYLDLLSDAHVRERFITRAKIITALRAYLDAHDFIEVETPILQPIAGGALARPFITHHNTLDQDFYLRIAPELYLKRLLIGGLERVYEIGRLFRNEGLSIKHNPEFTTLEYYMTHEDYHFAMTFLENMLRDIVQRARNSLQITFEDIVLDFQHPFNRLSVYDSLKTIGGCTDEQLNTKNIDHTLQHHAVELANKQASHGEKLFALFETLVESKITQPTFIMDYPIEVSPLAKRDPKNPSVAARFELFIAGMELANGYNELNNSIDQAERFKEQLKMRQSGGTDIHEYDADYVLALEHALAPAVGVGIGIDRLCMLLTNTRSIREVILFPALKRKD